MTKIKRNEIRGDIGYDEMTETSPRRDYSVNAQLKVNTRRIKRYQVAMDKTDNPRQKNYFESQIIDITRERENIISGRFQNMCELLERMETRTGVLQRIAKRELWKEIMSLSDWAFGQ